MGTDFNLENDRSEDSAPAEQPQPDQQQPQPEEQAQPSAPAHEASPPVQNTGAGPLVSDEPRLEDPAEEHRVGADRADDSDPGDVSDDRVHDDHDAAK